MRHGMFGSVYYAIVRGGARVTVGDHVSYQTASGIESGRIVAMAPDADTPGGRILRIFDGDTIAQRSGGECWRAIDTPVNTCHTGNVESGNSENGKSNR